MKSREWQWPLLALLIASWCTGWLWLLLALTRPLPGIISMKPGMGALELLELPIGLPYPKMLAAIFLACLLPPLLLGMLRGCWDKRGRALEAMFWPFRSRNFWVPCLSWILAGIALLTPTKDRDQVDIVIMLASLLALVALPFFCLNPSTLDAPSPSRWWRPSWPGWLALLSCAAICGVCQVLSFVLGEIIRIGSSVWVAIGLSLLDELISASALVLAIALWLNRGRWRHAQGDLRRASQRGFIGEYVWQSLFVALVASAAVVPLLVIVVEGVFVLPQYDQWLKDSAVEAPWWFDLLVGAYRRVGTLGFVLAVPFGFYFGLAQGRLMRLHGVGDQIPAR